MRIDATATCLSWIPPTAVEGVFSLPFGLGVAHYDQPPPEEFPDVEALLSGDAIRFANTLDGWIEVEDGQVVSYGMAGRGWLGSTTVRLLSRGLTFAGVARTPSRLAVLPRRQLDSQALLGVTAEQTARLNGMLGWTG